MIESGSFAVFLGSAFLAFLMAYMLFNLSKNKEKIVDDEGNVFERETTTHIFLQLFLVGVLLLSLVINGYAVMDASNRLCQWNVANSTYVDPTSTYSYSYECVTQENSAGLQYLNLILWSSGFIGLYVILQFLYAAYNQGRRAVEEFKRRQGR